MNLDGWDTASFVSVELVNRALAESAGRMPASFAYHEQGLEIAGRFGPWRLAPGGTLRLVQVAMPIREGRIAESGRAAIDLAGVSLRAQMRLRMIEDRVPGAAELCFDTGPGGAEGGLPITVTEVEDPSARIAGLDLELVKAALSAALSAHAAEASFVFATVPARGTGQAAGLACPANDWAFVDLGGGRQYLALLGSLDRGRPAREIRIDPALLAPAAPACYAMSGRLFAQRALLPAVQQHFRPSVPFAAQGAGVVSTRPAGLGRHRVGVFSVSPMLRSVRVSVAPGGLAVRADADAELPLWTRLEVRVQMALDFGHDPDAGSFTFRLHGKPEVSYQISRSGVIGHLLGFIVDLIVALSRDAVLGSIAQIATRLQAIGNPASSPAVWTGVRDFRAALARFDDVIWMADTRPVPAPADRDPHAAPAR